MSGKTTNLILLGILSGVILGGLLGFYASDFMLAISILGRLFINALVLLALPLIVTALVVGVTTLGDYRKLARVGGKTVWYFSLIGVIAVVIGIAATYVNPAEVLGYERSAARTLTVDSPYLNYSELINGEGLFNFLLSNGQYLIFVLLAVFFGGVLTAMGARNNKNIRNFFKEVHEGLLKLFAFMLYLAPVGLFSLVGTAVALHRPDLNTWFTDLGMYLLMVTVAFVVMGVIVLPLFLKLSGHQSPVKYFLGMLPALFTALGTGSSTAALPITYAGVVERNDIDQRSAALVLPLGTVFNVGATAMWLIMTILFLSQGAGGNGLSLLQIIIVAVLSLLVSIGLAGVPQVGLALAVVIMAAGLPAYMLAGMVTIAVAPLFIDRLRACLNVWGDAVGAAVISESLEFKAVGRVKKTTTRESRPRTSRRGRKDTGKDRQKADSRRRSKPTPRRRDSRDSGSRSESRKEQTSPKDKQTGSFQKNGKRSPFEMKASSTPDFDSEKTDEQPGKEDSGYKTNTRKSAPPPKRSESSENRTQQRKAFASKAEQKNGKIKEEKKEESGGDILDNEGFKKELARVSAHLQDIDNKQEETISDRPAESDSAKERELPESESERKEPEKDISTSNEGKSRKEASVSESEKSEVPDTDEVTSQDREPVALQYGRSRYHRPEKSKSDDLPAPPPVSEEDAPKAEDSFSNENISFGRTKKKKTR